MQPIKRFVSGPITPTVWNNIDKEQKEYKTISFARNYKDKEGKWKSTNSLRINDLPRASLVLSKAYEFLVITDNNTKADTLVEDVVY